MFDYHMHTVVSYDGNNTAEEMLQAAVDVGLKEICFTDHIDYDPRDMGRPLRFSTQDYNAAYDHLEAKGLKIRKGFEFGMLRDNQALFKKDLQRRNFDFVLGSAHFVDGLDPYFDPFWENKTMDQAEWTYFEDLLACVQAHDDFDVLGHLTYISKAWSNPTNRPIRYDVYREITDEIMKELVRKDKGMEINTSGRDPVGVFLPSVEFLRRFKELGGKIVTVGSDAHNTKRVGQYCNEACELACEIFGYVCTFENRQPVFHKL